MTHTPPTLGPVTNRPTTIHATQAARGVRQLSEALSGCSVLLPVDRRSTELAGALQRHGAETSVAPPLTVIPHYDDAELIERTRELIADPPDIVIATTGVGFRGWIDAAESAGLGDALTGALGQAQILVRGPKARGAVQQAGLETDWVAESETSGELTEFLLAEGAAGRRIAVQHHGAGDQGMEDTLRSAGAEVRGLTVYRWGPPADPALVGRSTGLVAAGDVDAVLFTSAPGVRAWLETAEQLGTLPAVLEMFRDRTMVAAVGPVSAAPLRLHDIDPVVPDRYRLGAMVRETVNHLAGDDTAVQTAAGALHVRTGGVLLDGSFHALGRTATDILRLFARRPGAVLSRRELLDGLVGRLADGQATDHAVEVTVARIREKLGAGFIETVYKRGYRLAV